MNVTVRGHTRHYRTVTFDVDRNAVQLIEQRLLPHEFQIVATRDFKETALAIKDMIVRGAGAIGATAAYGWHKVRGRFADAIWRNFPNTLISFTEPSPMRGRLRSILLTR